MREAPLEVEGRRDNLAETVEKLCLIHQFGSGHLSYIAYCRTIAGHHASQNLEEHDGARLIDLHVGCRVGFDQDEGDARIRWAPVAFVAHIAEPGLPVLFI